eukprot:38210-Eustigmatos_ZCMA.PRE.1
MYGTQIASMNGGTGYSTHSTPGHSNRIFSLKFYAFDPNIIVSGGSPLEMSPSLADCPVGRLTSFHAAT